MVLGQSNLPVVPGMEERARLLGTGEYGCELYAPYKGLAKANPRPCVRPWLKGKTRRSQLPKGDTLLLFFPNVKPYLGCASSSLGQETKDQHTIQGICY